MRLVARTALPLALLAALAAGFGGSDKKTTGAEAAPAAQAACPKAWRAGWQRLADRVGVPVYCPAWLPSPLTGRLGGPWNSVLSVGRDRSYLVSFLYREEGGLEVHVILRGYPGRTRVPTCRSVELVGGRKIEKTVPCFSDRRGTRRVGGVTVTVYTANRDADEWHVLYAWRRGRTLYSLSEHVAPPFSTVARVMRNLDRMMRSLALVAPRS